MRAKKNKRNRKNRKRYRKNKNNEYHFSCNCLDGADYTNDYDGVEDYVDDSEIVNCKKNNSRAILSIINT